MPRIGFMKREFALLRHEMTGPIEAMRGLWFL